MNVTEAVVLPEEILAVPIVGAPGIRGHVPALVYWAAWSLVQMPEADAVVGAVGFLLIMPPGYCLLMLWVSYTS